MCYYISRVKIFKGGLIMKKIIMLSLLVLSICITWSVKAEIPAQRLASSQKSGIRQTNAIGIKQVTQSQSTSEATTVKRTTRAIARKQSTTKTTEEETSSAVTSTESSATISTSANNSVLFGKNKMLSIAAWTLIGVGVLFVLIVVLGGKSRRNRRPFQKRTKRYKNRSKYNNYSDRYRSNIKRK